MNIFIITYFDMGGGPHRLATAINENTEHYAVAARWDVERWTTGGLFAPTPIEVRELFAWADVVQIQNTIISQIPDNLLHTKPMIFYYRGDDFRLHHEKMKARAKDLGALESVNFLDLAAECDIDRWLPIPVEDFSHLKVAHDGFVVTQCPSARERFVAKNTPDVMRIMSKVTGMEFRLITGVSWPEALEKKGQCDVVIDQFLWGYGNAGVEAMSMGIPVLADARPEIIDQMMKRIGYLPFIRCTLDELPEQCLRLKKDRQYREEWADIGRQYWLDFHAPAAVAGRATEMFQETIDLWEG